MVGQGKPPASLVVRGGTVLTFDGRGTVASAFAVNGGRIVAIGDDISAYVGQETDVLELAGRTVLPGINDAHLHAAWLGARWPHTIIEDDGFAEGEEAPMTNLAERREAILRAGELCASLGITSYTEPGLGPGETGCFSPEVLEEYAALAREGRLRARVTVLRLFGLLDGRSSLEDFERGLATPVPESDRAWLDVSGVKIFADGIAPMCTAWTHHGYHDGSHGSLLVDGEDDEDRARKLAEMISLAHAAGLSVGVHATGDRSIEAALARLRRGDHIVHGDLVTPAQLTRMASAGVGLTTQPAIAAAMGGALVGVLGADVAAKAWPLREMLDSGVVLTLSSDAPVVTPDWRVHVAAAAKLLGVRGPDPELMTRLLRCYTAEAAVQDGAAGWKGTLERGKVADFVVLASNPLDADPAALPGIGVEATFTGGRCVHSGLLR
ncbi:Imidazolonepropionase [Amycolatopsis sp. CA-230715]|nr:Imidazolonepropionase [Amycolatopsis sp. CA-230715]